MATHSSILAWRIPWTGIAQSQTRLKQLSMQAHMNSCIPFKIWKILVFKICFGRLPWCMCFTAWQFSCLLSLPPTFHEVLFSSSWVRLLSPFAHCHSDGAFKYYIQVLECVAFPFSRGSSQPRDRTQVSHITGGIFTNWDTRETPYTLSIYLKYFVQYC